MKNHWGRALLLALGFFILTIPFYRIIYFSDRALLFRDLARDLLAQKSIWVNSIRNGNGIPYWNHFSMGGTLFYAMNVGSPLHPLNFIFLLFPYQEMSRALSFYLIFHYFIFCLGAYFLLRFLKFSSAFAVLLSSNLTLSGYLVSAHSLGHLLASAVAVPWFFYFLLSFKTSEKYSALFATSFCIAWPIYAGDPQFSYFLSALALPILLKTKKPIQKKLLTLFILFALSIMAAAAQLLPTLDAVMQSDRVGIKADEILSFSFHPIRLAETFFPNFFGNRFGKDLFWAGEYINFPYKNPFIFSTYPGALTILALLYSPVFLINWYQRRKFALLLFFLIVPIGFLISFGAFFPIPLYEYLYKFLPLFNLFRYPERILFWPLISAWFLSVLILWRIYKTPKLLKNKKINILPVFFLISTLLVYVFIKLKFFSLPLTAEKSLITTFLIIGSIVFILNLNARVSTRQRVYCYILILLVHCCDLFLNTSSLVWDQTKYVADKSRYKIIVKIQEDLEKRKNEILHGASQRFSAENFTTFLFIPTKMDHTTSTTFSAFENLAPNTASYFGIEDTAGYFSFFSKNKTQFWQSAIRSDTMGNQDYRFYHDLMSAYYVPTRDESQQIIFKTNPTALPYIYAPAKILSTLNSETSFQKLQDPDFRSNKDVIITNGKNENRIQIPSNENSFLLEKRDGKKISFSYKHEVDTSTQIIVLNESFDPHWQAKINGQPGTVLVANAWAMAIELTNLQKNSNVSIEFEYKSPYILWGQVLTLLWFFAFALHILKNKYKSNT